MFSTATLADDIDPEVVRICESAARALVHGESLGWLRLDYEDVRAHALLIAVELGDLVRACLAGEGLCTLGTLWTAVYRDLLDHYRVQAARAIRLPMVSADARYDDTDERYRPPFAGPDLREPVEGYPRKLVENLLPHLWTKGSRLSLENAPDTDMPRGASVPSTNNTYVAMCADLSMAYELAELTRDERAALLLVGGLRCTESEAATYERVDRSTINRRYHRGVDMLVATLERLGDLLALKRLGMHGSPTTTRTLVREGE